MDTITTKYIVPKGKKKGGFICSDPCFQYYCICSLCDLAMYESNWKVRKSSLCWFWVVVLGLLFAFLKV